MIAIAIRLPLLIPVSELFLPVQAWSSLSVLVLEQHEVAWSVRRRVMDYTSSKRGLSYLLTRGALFAKIGNRAFGASITGRGDKTVHHLGVADTLHLTEK